MGGSRPSLPERRVSFPQKGTPSHLGRGWGKGPVDMFDCGAYQGEIRPSYSHSEITHLNLT